MEWLMENMLNINYEIKDENDYLIGRIEKRS